MIGDRLQEHDGIPKSRRELRRKRQGKVGGLAGLIFRRRKLAREAIKDDFRDYGVPQTRRERREFRQKRRARRWKKWRGGLREFLVTIFVAFVLVFGIVRPFVVEAYRIPSESMVPTLEIGDRILANKFIYRFSEPERGEIVVFDSVEGDDETLIKRVVGVEGDKIRVRRGTLYVNGVPQNEPYLNQEHPFRGSYGPTRVPPGHVFLMGDNRANSADSRVFGPVPLENIEGEAFFRFWPILKIGPLSSGG